MKFLAAYLLLNLAGVDAPSKEQIVKILSSVGIESDDDRLEKLLSELEGKNISELIAEGSAKLASVPSGGAAAASSGAAAGGAAEEAKEEAKEEEKEESDDDMGFGLFD